ncbi:hypothetical protein FKM82_009846 [Ascaphus truei]
MKQTYLFNITFSDLPRELHRAVFICTNSSLELLFPRWLPYQILSCSVICVKGTVLACTVLSLNITLQSV